MKTVTGYLCGPRVYEYKCVVFEVSGYAGPWPLRKDGEPKKRAGDKFYSLYAEWDALPDKESYRVGGGCWPIIKEVSDENG